MATPKVTTPLGLVAGGLAEVALFAKLACHKNAAVALSHCAYAMRSGEDAVMALDRAHGEARHEGNDHRNRRS
jgi:hypothetical protein